MTKPSLLRNSLVLAITCAALNSCSTATAATSQKTSTPEKIAQKSTEPKPVRIQKGMASWYSVKTNFGTTTASGRRLRNHESTAAHKTLPFGTRVRVVNLRNGKSEIVKITDRGPYIRGRVIDVTTGVAQRIGFYGNGVTPVRLEILSSKS